MNDQGLIIGLWYWIVSWVFHYLSFHHLINVLLPFPPQNDSSSTSVEDSKLDLQLIINLYKILSPVTWYTIPIKHMVVAFVVMICNNSDAIQHFGIPLLHVCHQDHFKSTFSYIIFAFVSIVYILIKTPTNTGCRQDSGRCIPL